MLLRFSSFSELVRRTLVIIWPFTTISTDAFFGLSQMSAKKPCTLRIAHIIVPQHRNEIWYNYLLFWYLPKVTWFLAFVTDLKVIILSFFILDFGVMITKARFGTRIIKALFRIGILSRPKLFIMKESFFVWNSAIKTYHYLRHTHSNYYLHVFFIVIKTFR